MEKFTKRLSSLIFWVVSLLGLSFLFQEQIEKIGTNTILGISAIILFIGLTYLIIIKITEFENSIRDLRQKFIRENELRDIRQDIAILKLKAFKR